VPRPDARRADPTAELAAVAQHMCELAGQLRGGGDLWRRALAAYRIGLEPVERGAAMPAAAQRYVDDAVAYAGMYAWQPAFVGQRPGSGRPSPVVVGGPGRPPSFVSFATRAASAAAPVRDLALDRAASATTVAGDDRAARYAFDGDPGTQWSSVAEDAQWIAVDLGAEHTVTGVTLDWGAGYAGQYLLEISDDGGVWTRVYEQDLGDGGVDRITVPSARARYVRVWLPWRGTGDGFSLRELEVDGR
jgi:hypothetical protein